MINKTLQERLQQLEKQRSEYGSITNMLFNNASSLTEAERVAFISENKTDIEKLKKISSEIRDIRWQLMTPEQQKNYLEKHS